MVDNVERKKDGGDCESPIHDRVAPRGEIITIYCPATHMPFKVIPTPAMLTQHPES